MKNRTPLAPCFVCGRVPDREIEGFFGPPYSAGCFLGDHIFKTGDFSRSRDANRGWNRLQEKLRKKTLSYPDLVFLASFLQGREAVRSLRIGKGKR